jgi:teichoic acid transport system permease protein
LGALTTILKDNWKWRKQISRLAVFELVKKVAALFFHGHGFS